MFQNLWLAFWDFLALSLFCFHLSLSHLTPDVPALFGFNSIISISPECGIGSWKAAMPGWFSDPIGGTLLPPFPAPDVGLSRVTPSCTWILKLACCSPVRGYCAVPCSQVWQSLHCSSCLLPPRCYLPAFLHKISAFMQEDRDLMTLNNFPTYCVAVLRIPFHLMFFFFFLI